MFVNGAYRTTRPWGPALETRTGVNLFQQLDTEGLVLTRLFQLGSEWRLASFWTLHGRFILSPAAFDDREIGDGAALERPRRVGGLLEVASDPRRVLSANVSLRGEWLRGGARYAAGASLRLRLFPQLDFDVAPEVNRRSGEPRFVEREVAGPEVRYRFGELRATSLGTIVRLTWTFTPRLTLQTYAQLFLLEQRVLDFTLARASAPGARVRLRDLERAGPPAENPDEREGVINANVLLRWEYRLGSALYLVYTRSQRPREEAIAPGASGLDVGEVTRGPAANTVLVKLSVWWG
jgi:hypothetical protein